jgi:hypothetical protein
MDRLIRSETRMVDYSETLTPNNLFFFYKIRLLRKLYRQDLTLLYNYTARITYNCSDKTSRIIEEINRVKTLYEQWRD